MIPSWLRRMAGRMMMLLLLGLPVTAVPAATAMKPAPDSPAPSEYDIKAVFLYNFTRYLQWPDENGSEAFEIAVLGDSEILAPLREISAKKTVRSAPVIIRQCRDIGQIGHPHILFLARPATPMLRRVLEAAEGAGILTVGEEEGLAERGVAVNLVLRDGAVKFEMNEEALRGTGIQAGSQLLKLAILVGGEKAENGR